MEEDKRKKELIEAKNKAENLIYTAKKLLNDLKGMEKMKMEKTIEKLKEVINTMDIKEIKKRSNELSKIIADIVVR